MVSVCMATYNGERFIRQQIESILYQLGPLDELIISDDGSTDKTCEIICSIHDSRIKLYKGNFRNINANFSNALKHANGDIIFLSDQDDVWIDGKVNKMKLLLNKYDLVISDSFVTDEQLNIIIQSFFKFFKSGKGIVKNIVKSSYYGACMAFKKKLLNKALPLPATSEIGHDLWLGLVAELTGTVYFFPEQLIYYRRHSAAFCETGIAKSKRSLYQQLRGRCIMLKEVLKFLLFKKYAKRTRIYYNSNV